MPAGRNGPDDAELARQVVSLRVLLDQPDFLDRLTPVPDPEPVAESAAPADDPADDPAVPDRSPGITARSRWSLNAASSSTTS